MERCPHCQAPLVAGDYFCERCERQTTCRGCDARLRADDTCCAACGTPIVPFEPVAARPAVEIVVEEQQTSQGYSRQVTIRATDEQVAAVRARRGGASKA
jgi:predicted amidophosphoribosyltransferase